MIGVPVSSEELLALQGAKWRLWSYTCSHDRLTVEITTVEKVRYHLDLAMCEEIRAPVFCYLSELSCEQLPNGSVVFRARNIEVSCRSVYLMRMTSNTSLERTRDE